MEKSGELGKDREACQGDAITKDRAIGEASWGRHIGSDIERTFRLFLTAILDSPTFCSVQLKNSHNFCDPFTKKLFNQCPKVGRVYKEGQADMSFTEGSLIRRVPSHTALLLLSASAGEMLAELEEAEVNTEAITILLNTRR